jgi:WD40 repeat protein
MSDVFITYSRVDKEFVRWLCQNLEAQGRDVWVDWEDIPFSAEWMREVQGGIEGANAVLVVLSPDWLNSAVCAQEFAHAIQNNKRLIPVVMRDVDPQKVPGPLAAINWIFMRQGDDYQAGLNNLVTSLDTDLDWVRFHTRLQVRALEWEVRNRNPSMLLREDDLKDAESWLARAAVKDPQPTPLQVTFLQVSRVSEIRRRRNLRSAISAGTIIVLLLGALALYNGLRSQAQQNLANTEIANRNTQQAIAAAESTQRVEQENIANTQSAGKATQQTIAETESARRITQVALTELEARANESRKLVEAAQVAMEKNPQRSLLLAVAAIQVNQRVGEPPLPLAVGNLLQLLSKTGGRGFGGEIGNVYAVAISNGTRWLAAAGEEGNILLWDLAKLDPSPAPLVLHGHSAPVTALAFSPNGLWLASASGNRLYTETYASSGGETILWNMAAVDPSKHYYKLQAGSGRVNALAISPDGRWLALASTDATARLWDLTVQEPSSPKLVLKGHGDWIRALTFSSDSQFLVTGSADKTTRLWNFKEPSKAPLEYELGEDVSCLAVSPDGHWLAVGLVSGVVRLIDLTGGPASPAPLNLVGHGDAILFLAFSPDSQTLLSASADKTARLWSLKKEGVAPVATVLSGPGGPITAFTMSPAAAWMAAAGGKELFCGGGMFACNTENVLWFWNLYQSTLYGQALALNGHEDFVQALASSPDGRWLVSGSADGSARLWDTEALLALPVVLRGHIMVGINDLAVSEDNRWLATAGDDNTVRLWDLTEPDQGKIPVILKGHQFGVNAVAFSPDNRWLISADGDNIGRLWDLSTLPNLVKPVLLEGHTRQAGVSSGGILAVAVSPDSRWLATGSTDFTVRLWDLKAPNPGIGSSVLDRFGQSVTSLAFSPDGKWLVAGSRDNTLRMWDFSTFPPKKAASLGKPAPGTNGINQLAISKDGRWLGAASDDGHTYLWDLTATEPAASWRTLSGHDGSVLSLAFSEDGHWLVTTGFDASVYLWDLSAADMSKTGILLAGHSAPVWKAAVSPDNRWLATGDEQGSVLLWDLAGIQTTREPFVLKGHSQKVNDLTFTSDNHWLISASLDDTVQLWPLEPDRLTELACRTAGRDLSSEEMVNYLKGDMSLQPCK